MGEASSEATRVGAPGSDPAEALATQLARHALFGFILTFIAARTVVFLIMARRMPNLYFSCAARTCII